MIKDDPIRVAIIAPTLAVRVGLQALLEAVDQIEVVAVEAELAALLNLPPEVDILLATSGAGSNEEWGACLQTDEPRFALLMIAEEVEDVQIIRRSQLQIWGILHQDASQEELIAAILGLHQGLVVVPPELLEPLLTTYQNGDAEDLVEPLTPRETEVLELLAQGLANKQIAYELEISDHTVKFHISSVYRKLGATNRAEAVRIGIRLGLVLL
ncbi:MAG: response regulator transcription factor [Anaerolineales bacterium]|nr:response regulator transcription factor [Chloroflexota bacterium]MBL6980806.1 response regulator transcription factor [Anaerolineales bacterium]